MFAYLWYSVVWCRRQSCNFSMYVLINVDVSNQYCHKFFHGRIQFIFPFGITEVKFYTSRWKDWSFYSEYFYIYFFLYLYFYIYIIFIFIYKYIYIYVIFIFIFQSLHAKASAYTSTVLYNSFQNLFLPFAPFPKQRKIWDILKV